MKKLILGVLAAIAFASPLLSYEDNAAAYVLYLEANEYYRTDDLVSAKNTYVEMISTYPESSYVPYALYMLSFLESDTLQIIDYLTLIEDNYPDFRYWANSMERLGDVYYTIGTYAAAIEAYELSQTEKSLYMIAVLYSADGFQEEAVTAVNTLLSQTSDFGLAYRAYLLQAKAYTDMYDYASALIVLKKASEFLDYAFDEGARLLYYTGKCYFYRTEYTKAFYAFTILRTNYPYAAESTLAKNFLTYLVNNNIIVAEPIFWLESYFLERSDLPFVMDNIDILSGSTEEEDAEDLSEEAEVINGQIVLTEVQEYVVRISDFQDLGVANLVAIDLADTDMPVGIYFRDGVYYAEIRGVQDKDTAMEYAESLIGVGYTDTEVIEVVKITEYGEID